MSKIKNELKNDPLMPVRHTAEHILHTAMQELYPQLKKVMGPPIEDGFYFDFDLDEKISVDDFPEIEKVMQEIIAAKLPVTRKEVSLEEAKELFKDNQYKLDWLNEIESRNEKITVFEIGTSDNTHYDLDLCAGPHVENTGEVKAFKLLNISGAYYKGSEKNKMLQRIYATAFDSKKALEEHLELLEEAKRRDHRKLGKELEIFSFAEEIGPGLPLWLPKGTVIKDELEKWGKETEDKWGYVRVSTPFLTKRKLFEISSHIPYFEDEMYKVSVPGDPTEEYFVKPMNCPFHHMIFKTKVRSYRELPLRMAEYGTVARYENAGAINGILRPRLFVQNDAHVYCTEEQAVDVFVEIINMHKYYYDTLGLKDYYIVLALRDPEKMNKYHGDEEIWQKAEQMSREAMDKAGIKYTVVNEGAAHYGPKMDFKIKSAIGNEYGISTNQIDLFMPRRFDLKYSDKDGNEKYVVVQHRAPLGSSERFVGFLLEHFAGAFPTWLAPVQAEIIPIGEKHQEYAQKVATAFRAKGLRIEVDNRNETMQARIRDAQGQKVPYMFILGDKEVQDETISVRLRTGENLGAKPLEEVLEHIADIYLTKSLKLW
jgi:threonyl-tRNA synthetase